MASVKLMANSVNVCSPLFLPTLAGPLYAHVVAFCLSASSAPKHHCQLWALPTIELNVHSWEVLSFCLAISFWFCRIYKVKQEKCLFVLLFDDATSTIFNWLSALCCLPKKSHWLFSLSLVHGRTLLLIHFLQPCTLFHHQYFDKLLPSFLLSLSKQHRFYDAGKFAYHNGNEEKEGTKKWQPNSQTVGLSLFLLLSLLFQCHCCCFRSTFGHESMHCAHSLLGRRGYSLDFCPGSLPVVCPEIGLFFRTVVRWTEHPVLLIRTNWCCCCCWCYFWNQWSVTKRRCIAVAATVVEQSRSVSRIHKTVCVEVFCASACQYGYGIVSTWAVAPIAAQLDAEHLNGVLLSFSFFLSCSLAISIWPSGCDDQCGVGVCLFAQFVANSKVSKHAHRHTAAAADAFLACLGLVTDNIDDTSPMMLCWWHLSVCVLFTRWPIHSPPLESALTGKQSVSPSLALFSLHTTCQMANCIHQNACINVQYQWCAKDRSGSTCNSHSHTYNSWQVFICLKLICSTFFSPFSPFIE